MQDSPTLIFRAAVISDIHASTEDHERSYLSIANPNNSNIDAFDSLLRLIERDSISADVVLCPGDISNKASSGGLRYAWRRLQDISQALGARRVLATAGNHDLDSRYEGSNFDAKGTLLSLSPSFPTGDISTDNEYWARNCSLIEMEHARVVVLNSCAYHGISEKMSEEHLHGRVSSSTIDLIISKLRASQPKTVNICLCHHHPIPINSLREGDVSEIKGGCDLVDVLSSGEYGEWIIVHGHKHYPRLTYAAGGAESCIVFGAGSFSAKLWPEAASRTNNQFYIIEFHVNAVERVAPLLGVVRSWNYVPMKGWSTAERGRGLPDAAGFGVRERARKVSGEILDILKYRPDPYLEWSDVVSSLPRLRHILPEDMSRILNILSEEHSVRISYDDTGTPMQLSGGQEV